MSLDELIEGLINNSAGEAGMMMVYLLLGLVAGKGNLCCVDDDDIVTYVNKRSVLRLVLAAQAGSNLSCNTADGLAGNVYNVPVTLDVGRFCNLSFHLFTH